MIKIGDTVTTDEDPILEGSKGTIIKFRKGTTAVEAKIAVGDSTFWVDVSHIPNPYSHCTEHENELLYSESRQEKFCPFCDE